MLHPAWDVSLYWALLSDATSMALPLAAMPVDDSADSSKDFYRRMVARLQDARPGHLRHARHHRAGRPERPLPWRNK